MGEPLLCVDDLEVAYGGIRAVRGVSLAVSAGETVALIGPNGAGKSSTLRAIMGLAPRTGGQLRFAGRPLPSAPEDVVKTGLTLAPEGRRVFEDLSVADNLKLGGATLSPGDRAHEMDRALQLFPILRDRIASPAGVLSGGEQQQLAIARAIMSRPRLLLLDEPSLGLAPQMTAFILSLVAKLRESGLGVLMVEQNVRVAFEYCDRVYVMVGGRIVRQDFENDVRDLDEIVRAYFGVTAA